MAAECTLHQFYFSHYNEKARWALDWKRVPHRRENLLPGPHARRAKRLSGGTETPILVIDGEVIAGSSTIVEAVDARFAGPALVPDDPDARAEMRRSSSSAAGARWPRCRCPDRQGCRSGRASFPSGSEPGRSAGSAPRHGSA